MRFLMTKILVKYVYYFSDGAASQNKKYKNLCNLCFHVADHQVTAAWSCLLPVMAKAHVTASVVQ